MSAKFRYGIVSEKDSTKGVIRVHFDDDDIVSDWIPVIQASTLTNKHFDLPDVNSHVACLMDEFNENGVCLGCIYSEADTVPAGSADKVKQYLFEDGSFIKYDADAHKYTLNITGGNVEIITDKDVIVNCDNATITAQTKVTIDVPSAEFTGDIKVGGKTEITGDVTLDGKLSVTGDASIGGKADVTGVVTGSEVTNGTVHLSLHVHAVSSVGSPTGPPTG